MKRDQLRLYLVTARYEDDDATFLRKIETACQSGVTMVQLREKEVSTARFYDLACQVKQVTDRYGLPLIINDRVDICLAVDASGVHIGDDELPVAVTRRLIGPDKLLGVSAKTVDRACEAAEQGADYLGVGAIFPTQTKVVTRSTSVATLSEIVAAVELPVVAIGGIDETKLDAFVDTGISGVAVVSRLMQATNLPQTCQDFLEGLDRILGGQGHDQ